ncbi:unnamed protein product [Trichogramma brassicae]|uniref:Uncharacterized protein n=1 Tax=Trichogramma brassicae TaxID=86971 RepID=A0A6H5IYB6_9HYME|nr:unnamed protein product [Trichogramma brassicae]
MARSTPLVFSIIFRSKIELDGSRSGVRAMDEEKASDPVLVDTETRQNNKAAAAGAERSRDRPHKSSTPLETDGSLVPTSCNSPLEKQLSIEYRYCQSSDDERKRI